MNTYYGVYFPAFNTFDTAFLSTDKKFLESEYASYILENCWDTLQERRLKINNSPESNSHETDAEFSKTIEQLDNADILIMFGCYVKKVTNPILNEKTSKQGSTFSNTHEFGEILIENFETDPLEYILEKPTLASTESIPNDKKEMIDNFLAAYDYTPIYGSNTKPLQSYSIPVVYQVSGRVDIQATSFNDAVKKLQDPDFVNDMSLPSNPNQALNINIDIKELVKTYRIYFEVR